MIDVPASTLEDQLEACRLLRRTIAHYEYRANRAVGAPVPDATGREWADDEPS